MLTLQSDDIALGYFMFRMFMHQRLCFPFFTYLLKMIRETKQCQETVPQALGRDALYCL